MIKKQRVNPYLPSWEYIPEPFSVFWTPLRVRSLHFLSFAS